MTKAASASGDAMPPLAAIADEPLDELVPIPEPAPKTGRPFPPLSAGPPEPSAAAEGVGLSVEAIDVHAQDLEGGVAMDGP